MVEHKSTKQITFLFSVCQALEKMKLLRYLRVANFGDSVTVMPDPGYFNAFFRPGKVYRHVGIALKMYPDRYSWMCGRLVLGRPKRYTGLVGYLNQVWRSIKHLFACLLMFPIICALPLCAGQIFYTNHSCKEYVRRVKMNEETLRSMSLDDLYEKDVQIKRCKYC